MKNAFESKIKTRIWVIEKSQTKSQFDHLAAEEPLEIRLENPKQTIAITMRTPGADFDLTAGFLYGEGIISQRKDLQKISYCVDRTLDEEQKYNIINVRLKEGLQPNLVALQRHFFTNSACGVCGKTSIEAIKIHGCSAIALQQKISPEIIYSLPDKLRAAQGLFTATGGLHAAALFDLQGQLIKLREDVGRHNALDKAIGSAFLADELPLNDCIAMVSGRSSFEILQKCIAARIPILCAVSAPSSLAVAVAKEFNLTLIGFLRGRRFNVYSGLERISPGVETAINSSLPLGS
jgi:FdhD protein